MTTEPISTAFDHIKAPNWNADTATQTSAPTPKTFRDLPLSEEVFKALDDVGYVTPTPVQAACAPLVLAGLDLIVQSQTGTGKTAAFALPTVELLEPGTCKVEVLVLAPTRELAKQVAGEFERLGAHKNIPVAVVYGGTGYQQQVDDLKTAQVVCATPGRLLDLIKRKALTLDDLKCFILDEADEMLNMGFEKELNAIVDQLPEVRQSLLFSATVTEDIQRLSSHILSHPEFVSLSADQVAAEEVHHVYYMVTGMGRLWDLVRILEVENPESAIIFGNTREDTFLVTNFLKKQGYSAEVLNGDLPQKDREETLEMLRQGKIRFLVATDVAARGIDISDLSHVVNYFLPESPETYIHRTGRTGRAGKQGVAISLIAPREIGTYYILRRVFKLTLDERELPTPEELVILRKQRALRDITDHLQGVNTTPEHATFARELMESPEAVELVARLLASFEQRAGIAPESSALDEAALRGHGKTNGQSAPLALPASVVVEEEAEEAEEEVVEAAPEAAEEAEVVAEAAPEAADEDHSADDEDVDEDGPRRRRRRRGRGRRRDEEAAEAAPEAAPEEAAEPVAAEAAPEADEEDEDDAPRRGRRRRRRRRGGDEAAEEAAEAVTEEAPVVVEAAPEPATPEVAQAADEDDDEDEPRRRRRRRGRGRGRREDEGEEAAAEEVAAAPAPAPVVVEAPAPVVVEAPEADEDDEEEAPRRRRRRRRGGDEAAEEVAAAPVAVEAPAPVVVVEKAPAPAALPEMGLIRLNLGKGRAGSERQLIELLCDLAGMMPEDFGDVTLRPRSSHVEARHDMVQDIIDAVNGQEVDGFLVRASEAT